MIQFVCPSQCDATVIHAVCSEHMHNNSLVTFRQIGSSFLPAVGTVAVTLGNAKVEYYLRIQCYCLQWLNVTHMDENSFCRCLFVQIVFHNALLRPGFHK